MGCVVRRTESIGQDGAGVEGEQADQYVPPHLPQVGAGNDARHPFLSPSPPLAPHLADVPCVALGVGGEYLHRLFLPHKRARVEMQLSEIFQVV